MTLAVDNNKFFITPSAMSTQTDSTTNSTLTATKNQIQIKIYY